MDVSMVVISFFTQLIYILTYLPNNERKVILNANERDLSLTSMHLRATRAFPTLPVLKSTDNTIIININVFKILPQSTSHHPPIASSFGTDLEYS